MVESINSTQSLNMLQLMQMQQKPPKPPSAEDMFEKLTQDVGGDGTEITKEQLEAYIEELESSDGTDKEKGKLGFLKQLMSNFDEISGGDDSITVDELKENMELLKPQKAGGPPPPTSTNEEEEENLWWDNDEDEDESSTTSELIESLIDIRV